MRLFLYYITHTFVNSIKKIFRTWVAIFIAVIIGFGVLIGLGAGFIADQLEGTDTQMESVEEEQSTIDEIEQEMEKPLWELFEELDETDRIFVCRVIADICFVSFLFCLLFNIYMGRKGGAEIFTMADVNFLFAAPMKPQSVLLFKTLLQMGAVLGGSIFFVFQIPNLILNVGFSLGHVAMLFLFLLIMLMVCKLVSILVYTVTATNISLRKYVQPLVYCMILLLVVLVGVCKQVWYENLFETVYHMFSGKVAMAIPYVGWTAGLVYSLLMKEYLAAVVYTVLILLGIVGLVYLIWKIKADFYEDALSNASTMQEKMEAVKTGVQVNLERSKRVKRQGEIGKGKGANAFFYKHIYNRKRFSYLGVLTNSMMVYSGIVLLLGIAQYVIKEPLSIQIVGGVLLACIFFKSYVSPMQAECKQNFIYLVPESPYKKIGYLLVAEIMELCMDLVPALFMMLFLFDGSFLDVILWLLVLCSFSLVLTAVALFIDRILPESLPDAIKAIFEVFGNFGGVLPLAIIVVVLAELDLLSLASVLSVVVNAVVAILLLMISASLLHKGRG